MAKTKAYLPVGTKDKREDILITKGDVVKLCTGEKVTFTEMKRVCFVGTMNGKGIRVPIWRNKYDQTPYILNKLDERDESVVTVSADVRSFKRGDLFALEGHKETFMFVKLFTKRGAPKIKAINVADNKVFTIDMSFTLLKINLAEVTEMAGDEALSS